MKGIAAQDFSASLTTCNEEDTGRPAALGVGN
jgi:hypothetical protein